MTILASFSIFGNSGYFGKCWIFLAVLTSFGYLSSLVTLATCGKSWQKLPCLPILTYVDYLLILVNIAKFGNCSPFLHFSTFCNFEQFVDFGHFGNFDRL